MKSKRILSIVICFALVFGMIPLGANAVEDPSKASFDVSEASSRHALLTEEPEGEPEPTPEQSTVSITPKGKVYDGKAYVLSASEYNIVGDGARTIEYFSDAACTQKATPVNAGNYYVKVSVAATDNYTAASKSAAFTISKAPTTISVSTSPNMVAPKASFTITATPSHTECETLTATVSWTETIIFNISSKDYSKDVTLNRQSNGSYSGTFTNTFTSDSLLMTTSDLSVTVKAAETANHLSASAKTSVVLDTQPPTASIKVGSKTSSSFVDDPKFNTFFNKAQTVTITANDSETGVSKVYYYISSTALTQSNLKNITSWKEGRSFTISPNAKCIIYAKIVDNVGNVRYISTDGLVLDNIAPVVSSIENGKTYYDGVTFTVNEEYIKSVTINSTAVTPTAGNIYAVIADATAQKKIVVTDKAGNTTTITITLLANPDGVAISAETDGSIIAGNSIALTSAVTPDYAYDKSTTWTSSNSDIATVDAAGVVTGKVQGTVTITASTVNGITASKTIKILPKTLRISGSNRIETSLNICKSGWTKTNNVIIANGKSFADALAAGPLAYKLDAPILLTMNDANYLDSSIMIQLTKMGVKNIYLIGGPGVINTNTEALLKALGYNVIRLSGADRFATAVKIAQKLDSLRGGKAPSGVYIANGMNYPDALSISPIAAIKDCPILFTLPASSSKTLHPTTSKYLKSVSFSNATVIGGAPTISDTVLTNLKSCGAKTTARIAGADRYATSIAIYNNNKSVFKSNDFAFATGSSFPDALSGSVFAAKKSIPVFLVGSSSITTAAKNAVQARPAATVYVFGGAGAVSNSLISNYLN